MASDSQSFKHLIGARLIAQDGQFLGIISTARFKPDSIANEFGEYGSRFKPHSIFNEMGPYGNSLSPYSAFNEHAQFPPKINMEEQFIAYLTRNTMLSPRVDPRELLDWLNGK